MKGKISYFKIFIVLLLSLFTLSFLNAKTIKAVDTRSVLVGNDVEVNAPSTGTFSYPIKIIQGTDIASLQFSLFYDLSNFQYEGYDDLGYDLIVNDTNPGKIILNFTTVDLTKRLQAGSSIIELHFKVKSSLNQGSYNVLTVDSEYLHKFGELTNDYQLIDIPNYNFNYSGVTLKKLGDLDFDGAITVFDATYIQMHLAGLSMLDDVQLSIADVNFDGVVNIIDATILRLVAAGLRSLDPNVEKVTVRFFDFYGDLYYETQIDKGSSINPPAPSTPEGFVFIGWNHDLTNITESMDVYAMFNQEEVLTVNQILGMPLNSEVILEGYVYYVVQNNLNDISGYYLQDYEGKPIYIYQSSTMTEIHVGDYIKLKGTYTLYYKQPEIINVNIIEHVNENNNPYYYRHEISISEIYNMDPNHLYYYGNLYTVFGTIILEGDNFYIEDEEGYRIRLRQGSTYTNQNGVFNEDFMHYLGQTGFYTVILADYHTTNNVWRAYTIPNSFESFNGHVVMFYDELGNLMNKEMIEDGQALYDLPFYNVGNLTLVGWYLEPELINQYIEGTPIRQSINLYPKFIQTDEVERTISEIVSFPDGVLVKTSGVITTYTHNPNDGLINGMYIKDGNGDLIYIYGDLNYSELGLGDFIRVKGTYTIYYNKPELIDIEIIEHVVDYEVLDFSNVLTLSLYDILEKDNWNLRNAGQLVKVLGTIREREGKYFIIDDSLQGAIELRFGSEYTAVGDEFKEDFLNHVGERGYYTLVISDYNTQSYNWRAYLIPNTFEESFDIFYGIEFRVLDDYDFGFDGYMRYRLNEVKEGVYGEFNMYFEGMSMELRYFKHNDDGTYTYYPSSGYVEVNTEGSTQVDFGGFLFYVDENLDSSSLFDFHGEIVSFDSYKGYYSGYYYDQYVSVYIGYGDGFGMDVYVENQYVTSVYFNYISKFEAISDEDEETLYNLVFDPQNETMSINGNILTKDIFLKDETGEYVVFDMYKYIYAQHRIISIEAVIIDIYNDVAILESNGYRLTAKIADLVSIGDLIHLIGNIDIDNNEEYLVEEVLYIELIDINQPFEDLPIELNVIELMDYNYYYNGEVNLAKFEATLVYIDGNWLIEVPMYHGTRYIEIRNPEDFDFTTLLDQRVAFFGHIVGSLDGEMGFVYLKEVVLANPNLDLPIVEEVYIDGEYIAWEQINNALGYYIYVDGVKHFTDYTEHYMRYYTEGEHIIQVQVIYETGLSELSSEYTFVQEQIVYQLWEIYNLGDILYFQGIQNASLPGLYTFIGTIAEVVNDNYGNMYLTNDNGDMLYVYGLYGENGQMYKDIPNKPVVGDEIIIEGTINYYNELQLKNATLKAITNRTYVEGLELYLEIGVFETIGEERVWVPSVDYLEYPLIYNSEMDAYYYDNVHIVDKSAIKFVIVYEGQVTRFPERPGALTMGQPEFRFDIYYSRKDIENAFDLRQFFQEYTYPFKVHFTSEQEIFNDIAYTYFQTISNITDEVLLDELETLYLDAKIDISLNALDIVQLENIRNSFNEAINSLIHTSFVYIEVGVFEEINGIFEWIVFEDYSNYPLEFDQELKVYKYSNFHLKNYQALRLVINDENGIRYFPEDRGFKLNGEEGKFDVYFGYPGEENYIINLSEAYNQYDFEVYINMTETQVTFNMLYSEYENAKENITDEEVLLYLYEELLQYVLDIDYYKDDFEALNNLTILYEELIDQYINPITNMEVYLEVGRYEMIDGVNTWIPSADYQDFSFTYVPEINGFVFKDVHVFNNDRIRFRIFNNGEEYIYPYNNLSLGMQIEEFKGSFYLTEQYMEGLTNLSSLFKDYTYQIYMEINTYHNTFNSCRHMYELAIAANTDTNILQQIDQSYEAVLGAIELYREDEVSLVTIMDDFNLLMNQFINQPQ